MAKKQGNRYNAEFKADIVRLIKEEGRTVTSIVKDFDISEQTVYNWLSKAKIQENPDKARIAELEAELKAERRKTADLEESVAILKKATAIFATHQK
jgi:transposase-like protein